MISLIDEHELRHVLRPTIFLAPETVVRLSARPLEVGGEAGPDGRPLVTQDAEIHGVAEAAIGQDHVVAEYALLLGAEPADCRA